MALSTGYLFTNETATVSKATSLYNMGETSNYGVKDIKNGTELVNTTGTTFGVVSEKLTYKSLQVPKVQLSIPQPNRDKNSKAVQYSVSGQAIIRSTDTDLLQDDGIYVQITICHDQSPYITEALIGKEVNRVISALQHTNGDWRFNELAAGATRPSAD